MEINDIKKILQIFTNSNVHSLKLEQDNFSLTLEKESINKKVYITEEPKNVIPVQQQTNTTSISQKDISTNVDMNEEESCKIITSPIVGTLYVAPNPDANPFVQVGSVIKKGQILCIIEAMKLMNEIESEYDGEIVEILVKNEQMVEYGQPLFKIK